MNTSPQIVYEQEKKPQKMEIVSNKQTTLV